MHTHLKSVKFVLAVLAISFIISCNEDEVDQGSVEFSFVQKDISNARIEEETVSKIVVTIETSGGVIIYEDHVIEISSFGSGKVSIPVLLEVGEYAISQFLVLNEMDEIIYATPKAGSALAGLVETPLDIEFEISADVFTRVDLEVIKTSNRDPENLGYTSFPFNIVPTKEVLICVLTQLGNDNYIFTEAELTVFHDGDSSFTRMLGDSINVVVVKGDALDVLFKVTSSKDSVREVTLDPDLINYHRTFPITIVFDETSDITSDLVAYYPFDGDALDVSGNELNGTVFGAVLTTDRDDNMNSAYEFTGNDDVITVTHDELLNITEHLTLSAWINLYSGNQWGSRIIDKVERGSANGYLLDIWNQDNTSTSIITTIRFIGTEGFTNFSDEEVSLNEWNHVAVTYSQGEVRFYLNGKLVGATTESESMLVTNNEILEIGNDKNGSGQDLYDPFRGKIDEVRIYSRTLNKKEVQALADFM